MPKIPPFYIRRLAFELLKNQGRIDFSSIRNSLPTTEYGLLIDVLRKGSKIHVLNKRKVESIRELDSTFISDPIPPEDELKWAKAILSRNIHTINEFVQLSNNYYRSFMLGEFDLAATALNTVEEVFGQSLWLIKNKIAFLQFTEGMEAQKKYVQNIRHEAKYKGFVAFIAHWVSIRNEATVTPSKFSSQIEQIFRNNKARFDEGYEPYLRYHLLPERYFDIYDSINIIRIELSRSLVDFYEAFLHSCTCILISGTPNLSAQVKYTLKKCNNLVDDRLGILQLLLNKNYNEHAQPSSIQALDLMLSGRFEDAEKYSLNLLSESPNDPIHLGIASLAKSKIVVKNQSKENAEDSETDIVKQSPYKHLVANLEEVLRRGTSGAALAYNNAVKFSLNFNYIKATSIINILFNSQGLNEPNNNLNTLTLIIKNTKFDPFILPYFFQNDLLNSLKDFSDISWKNEQAFKYCMSLATGEMLAEPECPDELNLLHAAISFKNNDFASSLKYANNLTGSNSDYFLHQAYKYISYSHLRLNMLKSCCSYICDIYLDNHSLVSLLPVEEIVDRINPGSLEWDELKSEIDLSIVLTIYFKHFGNNIESLITFAYEDYLESKGRKKPSGLLQDNLSTANLNKLVYFLRFVCIESIMDTSIEFNDPAEVVAERISVCKILMKIDAENGATYEREIKDLVRREVINNRMKEIDQSRIYVDIQKVKEWALVELKEGFHRYIDYLKHGFKSETSDKHEEARAKAAKFDIEGLLTMTVPDNEVNALFKHLIKEITFAYSSNSEYGLVRFLSTRIRHGALESKLRRPLDNYHLITKTEGKKGEYLSNDYWIEFLNADEQEAKKINTAFSRFSLSYDNLVKTIISEWLQIKLNDDEKGMFFFNISGGECSLLASDIRQDTTFDQFLDKVLVHLDDRLTGSLTNIRNRLNNEAKRYAISLINKLQEGISTIDTLEDINEIDAAINSARTDIQAAFDNVVHWFSPSRTVGNTPYKVEDAVAVAESIVKQSDTSFSAPIKQMDEITVFYVQGGLPTFIDILVNIFENVVKRSELEIPEAGVYLTCTRGDLTSTISIMVKNELGSSVDVESRKIDLDRRKEVLNNGNYADLIAKEGGSGFFKIKRSLKDFRLVNEKQEADLDFGIENNEFYIQLLIPVKIFPLEDTK